MAALVGIGVNEKKLKSEGPDDNKIVPEETQKKIVEFANETLFPAVMAYIAPKYPRCFGAPIRARDVGGFFFFWDLWEEFFTREQRIELYKMKIIMHLPNKAYTKTHLKALIRATIRICVDIGKPEFKDLLEAIVPDYFCPFPPKMENKDDVDHASLAERLPPEIENDDIWDHPDVQKSYPSVMRKLMSGIPDDFKRIPEKIQESIIVFMEETLFPEILARIQHECPTFFTSSIKHVSSEEFFDCFSSLESPFIKNHRDDFMKLLVVGGLPVPGFIKMSGKDLTGAAIRIIKDMGNQKMEDDLRDIVRGCFMPNPDITCHSRSLSVDKYVSFYQSHYRK